ncbi:MAG: SGNH/GDSL hydrolase family protein, partial [Candidatus Omnitrophota bacterium]
LIVNLILLAVSITVFLLVAEFLCRIFIKKPVSHNALFCEYDPLLGWSKIPNKKGVYSTSEYSVTESFNSKGLRGQEYSYEKKDGEYRILVLGDSFTEGYTVEFEELFSEVLKEGLNGPSKSDFEVINAGTAGYGTAQEFLFFRDEGIKYLPDCVVLMFYDNDVVDNVSERGGSNARPYFEMDKKGNLLLKKLPGSKSAISNKLQFIQFIRKSCFYGLVKERVKSTPFLYSLVKKMNLPITKEMPLQYLVYQKDKPEILRKGWAVTEALIKEIKKYTDYSGSELIVFYIPVRGAIYEKYWKRMKIQYGMKGDQWNVLCVASELESICKRNNISFINPVSDFAEEAKALESSGGMLYFKQDGHWNRYGHKAAGEMLAGYFKKKQLRSEVLYETE